MGCINSTPERADGPGQVYQYQAPAQTQGFTDVIFFPEPSGKMPCHNDQRPGGCRKGASCAYAHGPTQLGRLLKYLDSARSSIDICVFNITCDEIANQVLALHQRGVRVRIITDDEQAKSQGSDIDKFRQGGIPVKLDHLPTHMHHKFAVIDGRLLLTGSFNWTRQAVIGNQENVLVIDHPSAVNAFGQEFERLWAVFRP